MKLLVVGGGGYVGSILQPAFQKHHDYHCFDTQPIDSLGPRCIVADVHDDKAVRKAIQGMDAVVYLAMGSRPDRIFVQHIDLAFSVNLAGAYRFLRHSLNASVKRFVYASSLSVYHKAGYQPYLDEKMPPTAWAPYGLSKRLAEQTCLIAAAKYPQATITVLRLMLPRNEADFPSLKYRPGQKNPCALGPNDLRRLFLAALQCDQPGAHIVQASGDLENLRFPNTCATQLLGWKPQGN